MTVKSIVNNRGFKVVQNVLPSLEQKKKHESIIKLEYKKHIVLCEIKEALLAS